jgi:biopolymer transport protein ExbB/TolQ
VNATTPDDPVLLKWLLAILLSLFSAGWGLMFVIVKRLLKVERESIAAEVERNHREQIEEIEKDFSGQFKTLEHEFRDFREEGRVRMNIFEKMREEDVRRFDGFERKLDEMRKEVREDLASIRDAILKKG